MNGCTLVRDTLRDRAVTFGTVFGRSGTVSRRVFRPVDSIGIVSFFLLTRTTKGNDDDGENRERERR